MAWANATRRTTARMRGNGGETVGEGGDTAEGGRRREEALEGCVTLEANRTVALECVAEGKDGSKERWLK